jgi:hypothetical protein
MQALHDLGLQAPNSLPAIMSSLVLHQGFLSVRGLGFHKRSEREIEPLELLRIDALMDCSNTFGAVDSPRGMEFAARQVLRALRAGEPSRVAFALAMTANANAVAGGLRNWQRCQQLLQQARELAKEKDSPYLNAYLLHIDGIMHWTNGRSRASLALLEQAESLYRQHCSGVGWDLATVRILKAENEYYLGEVQRMEREATEAMADAVRRGDLYLQTCLGVTSASLIQLVQDNPERCRQLVFSHLQNWKYPGFSHYQISGLWRRMESHLYEGQATRAEQVLQEMPTAGKMMLRMVQCLRIRGVELQGRCAIAVALADSGRRELLLRQAEQQARKVADEDAPWAQGLAAVLRAGVAAVRSGPRADATLRELSHAEALLCASDMMLVATAVRRRRGELLGDAEGQKLFAAADSKLREQGIVNPARYTAMLVPGFPAGTAS